MTVDPEPGKAPSTPAQPTTEDLFGLTFVSDPQLAPGGRTVAAVVTSIVPAVSKHRREGADGEPGEPVAGTVDVPTRRRDSNIDRSEDEPPRYRGRVHLFTVPGGSANHAAPATGADTWPTVSSDGGLEFTQNQHRDMAPRFSPDGSRLAFLRIAAEKQPPQLYTMPLTGGEPVMLTQHEAGVGEFVWHPSGASLVYVSRGEKTDEAAESGAGRRIKRLRYRSDGEGFLQDAAADLYQVDLAGSSRRLTSTADDEAFGGPSSLAFSPDGETLYFCRTQDESAFNDFRSNVVALDLSSRDTRVLAANMLGVGGLAASPSGRYLSMTAASRQDDLVSAKGVWVSELDAAGEASAPRLISGELDVDPAEASDSRYGTLPNKPAWTASTGRERGTTSDPVEHLLVNIHRDGTTGLARLWLDGRSNDIHDRRSVRRAVTAFSACSTDAGLQSAFVAETPLRPGELWFRSSSGEELRLSGFNDAWCARLDLKTPAGPFTLANQPAGEIPGDPLASEAVQYWTLSPTDPRADDAVVLEVHGGPHTAYGNGFMFEFQLLVGRGYHVVYGNPRGSSSYGHHFATCMLGGYGSIDADDVLAIAAAAADRLGIGEPPVHLTGGSYGGFMTNWLVGVSDRFRSAVSQRSISNWTSMYGTSDIGPSFVERELCGVPWRDVELLWRQSPLRNAAAVVTPLLLIHSEEDYRCPIEQAEQFFSAIKRHGTSEVELLRFPAEGHELSRSGRPDRRMQRLDAIIDWFERHP